MIVFRVILVCTELLSKYKRVYAPYIEVINLIDKRYLKLYNKGKRKPYKEFTFKNQLELSEYLENEFKVKLKDFDNTLYNDIINISSYNQIIKFKIGE